MIFVTHDQTEAMTLGRRVCVLNEGRVMQTGAPLEVYRRPANTFVAQFTGSPGMNLLTGALAEELTRSAGLAPDGVLGVRPEDVLLIEGAGGRATVERCEPLGHETLVHLAAPDGSRLIARVAGGVEFAPQQEVSLRLRPGSALRFDARTGDLRP
jgi:ABC-type sugar transport system ATPase subunit